MKTCLRAGVCIYRTTLLGELGVFCFLPMTGSWWSRYLGGKGGAAARGASPCSIQLTDAAEEWEQSTGQLNLVSSRCPQGAGTLSPCPLPMPLGNRSSVTVLMLLLVLSWVFVRLIFLHVSPLLLSSRLSSLSKTEHYFEEVPGDLSIVRLSTKKLAGREPVKSSWSLDIGLESELATPCHSDEYSPGGTLDAAKGPFIHWRHSYFLGEKTQGLGGSPTPACGGTCLNGEPACINDRPLLLKHYLSIKTGKCMQPRMFCFISF